MTEYPEIKIANAIVTNGGSKAEIETVRARLNKDYQDIVVQANHHFSDRGRGLFPDVRTDRAQWQDYNDFIVGHSVPNDLCDVATRIHQVHFKEIDRWGDVKALKAADDKLARLQ